MPNKRCKRCKKAKPPTAYKTPGRKICNSCIKKKWKLENPEAFKAGQARWRATHKAHISQYSHKYNKKLKLLRKKLLQEQLLKEQS